MTAADAIAFVERHGIVLESARRDPLPSLAEAIAGEPVRGNWWSHREGRAIFALTRAVRESPAVLVCRLVGDKVTFVHERLWPALARLADRFAPARLARVRETHGASGAHRTDETPFPDWLPAETARAAERLGEADAIAALSPLLPELRDP